MVEGADRNHVTAILLSWKRPQNISRIVHELKRSPRVSEILLWNNDPENDLELPGVKVVNSPQNYHCLARYCMVPLAENNQIWFQDDDLLIRPEQLEIIHSAYTRDPARIYGVAGRNIVNGLYSADLVHGECEIVLGQAMLFHRSLLHFAFEPLGFIPADVTEDDIIFSLACNRLHFAVDVSPLETPGWDDDAALWKVPGHFERRQRAVDVMRAWQQRHNTPVPIKAFDVEQGWENGD